MLVRKKKSFLTEKAESAGSGGKLNLERKQPATIELNFGERRSRVPAYPVNLVVRWKA